jgi:uncharacterized protein (TIGR00725 family)
MQIGVIGPGDCTPGEYTAGMTTGRLLAAQGVTLCSGGLSGFMEAVCRGVKESGGLTGGHSRIPGQGSGTRTW